MQLKPLTASLMLISGSLMPLITLADIFPYTPRLSVTGLGGSNASVQADALIPLVGDNTQLGYGDLQGRYGKDDSWSGSLGAGYRRLLNNAIWGGYLFVDRNETGFGHHFWSISPGIERLSETWDFRLNGYLPVNNKNWQGEPRPANQVGIRDYIKFSGHTVSDRMVTPTEEVGKGVDVEVGYHLAEIPGLILTGAAYHYHYRATANVTGIGARIEYPITKYIGVVLSDSYDNEQRNQIAAGIKINLGGAITDPNKILLSQRFTDEVKRGIGVLGKGTLIPTQNGLLVSNQNQVLSNKVWFFAPKVGSGDVVADGTFEHPFIGMQQEDINKAGQNAWLYVQSGKYGWPEQINLQTGQILQGRITDYTLPAQQEQRPLFHGSVGIINQNDVTIDSVRFNIDQARDNDPTIAIVNANNVLVNNVLLQQNSLNNNLTLNVGINNSNNILIKDAVIENYALSDEGTQVIGINSIASNVAVENTKIYTYAQANSYARTIGIAVTGAGNSLSVRNSTLSVGAGSDVEASAIGIAAEYATPSVAENRLTIEHSTINASASGSEAKALANGIKIEDNNQPVKVSITHGTVIDAQAQSTLLAQANGIYFRASATTAVPPKSELYVDNTTINSTAMGAHKTESQGIYANTSGQHFEVTIKDSRLKANATSNSTAAVSLDNATATAILLESPVIHGNIMNNTLIANASAKFANASAMGLEIRKAYGQVNGIANDSELIISGNTLTAKALSEYKNAYSAGMYLADVSTFIAKNTINSHAQGNYPDLSRAYGIATNGQAEITDDNSYNISGHNAIEGTFTHDMIKFSS
ncbi:MAG: exported protein of unknown function, partial [Gammaproteobacteria bacterium]|nr:exported protein of unknown function [Gammaproteobacteria bacterium]